MRATRGSLSPRVAATTRIPRDNPEVEVRLQGKPKQPMHARVATPDERTRLWPEVITINKGYAGYQEKTDREIPLVLLEPK
jgi:deazaflavin-dependent oxidoreductase (nitroreductase family)